MSTKTETQVQKQCNNTKHKGKHKHRHENQHENKHKETQTPAPTSLSTNVFHLGTTRIFLRYKKPEPYAPDLNVAHVRLHNIQPILVYQLGYQRDALKSKTSSRVSETERHSDKILVKRIYIVTDQASGVEGMFMGTATISNNFSKTLHRLRLKRVFGSSFSPDDPLTTPPPDTHPPSPATHPVLFLLIQRLFTTFKERGNPKATALLRFRS